MPQPKPFWYGLLIAILYFLSVYFAVAALAPSMAITLGLIVAFIADIIYLVLVLVGQEEYGKTLGILLFFPVVFVTAGILWWILRLLGLWQVN